MRILMAKLHKYFGLVLLAFLFIEGMTGAVLVFRAPLDRALNPDLFYTASTGPAEPPAKLADDLAKAHPDWHISEILLQQKAGRTIWMDLSRGAGPEQIFVDPHTGKIIGDRSTGPGWGRRHIMAGLLTFHGNWLMGGFGRWLLGLVAIGWVLTNMVGLYLTFPVIGPFWTRWKKNWRINRGTKLLRFSLDVHRAGSLWLFLGLMILAITSVEINFYGELFAPVVNRLWQPVPTPFSPGSFRHEKPHPVKTGFADALRIAGADIAQTHPGWQPAFANHMTGMGLYGVSFTRAGADMYALLGPVAVYIDDSSGKVIYTDDPYREGLRGMVMRSLYPLHSGRIFGWPTRLIVFLLGLFTAILCVTGGYLWWRRRRVNRKRRR